MVKYSKAEPADDVEITETPVIDPSEETDNAAKTAFKSMKAKLLAMKHQPGSVFDFSEEIAALEEYLK